MQNAVNLNLNWRFTNCFEPAYPMREDFSDWQPVHLPHTVREVPYNCFSHTETAMRSTYAREFFLEGTAGKRVLLEFEGVMTYLDLYVNGRLAGSHKGGYSRALFDVTEEVHDGLNRMVVMVDSHERADIPPFGYTIDYLTYGGIYRDVNLYVEEPAYIRQFLFRYELEGAQPTVQPEVVLVNHDDAFDAQIELAVRDGQGEEIFRTTQMLAVEGGEQRLTLRPQELPEVRLWDLEDPALYEVELALVRDDCLLDRHTDRVGFRTAECKPDGFYLNGRMVRLVGLDRHQSYPYVGYAMGKRPQRKDADILRKELHLNTVRCSHYMQSKYFLERCDEIGLLVFEEIPGWGHIGGEDFRKVVLDDVASMICDHFNHPSIFLWGVRLNETLDDDDLYAQTNALAHALDPDRPTSGVRYIRDSHLLEDVYGMNDFAHEGGALVLQNQQTVTGKTFQVPYLVTEFNGHVYPTKPFDPEGKREEHALRHARVQSLNMLRRDSLGAIGWCAFDYNTHGDYGSGDKICYHGVMDMFRAPKYAAYVYASQKDPSEGIVMEPCSILARGDRDDNRPIPFTVLTNCDYIEVIVYGDKRKKYFPSLKYIGLPHPPIEVDQDPGRWQDVWQGATIIGYIGEEEVARREYSRDAYLAGLAVAPDDDELYCDRVDETRVVCRLVDQCGNLMPYYHGAVQVAVEGDLQVIGPDVLVALGGTVSFWVKTEPTGRPGKARVRIRALATSLPEQVVTYDLHR